ncbi:alpha/beta hydrolase [Enterovirga rhinocerotis]|uniref:Acetyl esterase n=1 Tax=Enterovirga rhinocerotis TaxID=1339210 RepID=A0A4R7BT97_9HYPH|nr:alpha/beta hydrolase [Enterovirga rhinocerotis]TDR88132.1 acetyl esterase [Enterovirga rhinocerotis]
MRAVHPDVEALIAAGKAAGSLPFEAMSPDEARRAYASRRDLLQLPPDAVSEKRDITIAGPGGPLALRLYRPVGATADEILPCLVYMHGGGWVFGNLESHDGLCCRLANEAGCCVVAVDYRLAPEHPFPAAVEDCASAYGHVAREAGSLRVDPGRLALGGDSAGGNLAAVLAIMARDGSLAPARFQILLYPVVDLDRTIEDYGPNSPGMTITGATMAYFLDHYAPDVSTRADWRASPIKAATLAGLPPALVVTCGHDPLGEEGRRYAERLERDGVAVTALHLADQTHGILTMTKVIRPTAGIIAYVGAALRGAFQSAPSGDAPAAATGAAGH